MTETTQTEAKTRLQSLASLLDIPDAKPEDPAIEAKAAEVVDKLITADPQDAQVKVDVRQALQTMGAALQRESAHRSQMLKQPIQKLYKESEESGSVGNALVDLKLKVEELDPGKFDFEAGWVT
ncbi:MAG TPA: hypothetical protein VJ417_05150, partial [Candidatus Glassbacteria bacterium]|nr:hypothetical protein [Candidatus Glassbacteria bacterium]